MSLAPSTLSSAYHLYVGLDVAAYTFTAAWLPAADARSVLELPQSTAGFAQLTGHLRQLHPDPATTLVVLEATGPYWQQLALHLVADGFSVSVLNPAQAHHFAHATLQRAKTDTLDARSLARLAQTLQPERWLPPDPVVDQLRLRLAERDQVLAQRTQIRNHLHALARAPVPVESTHARLQSLLALLNDHLAAIDRELQTVIETQPDWQASFDRLCSIPGVGPVTAWWLLVLTRNFTTCQRPDQLAAYAGLVPHPRQSGTSRRGSTGIGLGGHPRLSRALYMAAVSAVRCNPRLRPFYLRLLDRGKAKKVALCAVARKLCLLAFALVTHQTTFDPAYSP